MRLVKLLREESGQSLVLMALMVTALLGFIGLVVDIGWYQVQVARAQKAADAAALAGVVYLPGNPTTANTTALAEATKNGFTNGVGGTTVVTTQDPISNKVLRVSVNAQVRPWFSRLFGITSFPAATKARAEFILPVPMGSPLDYYGVATLCNNSGTCSGVTSATGVGTLASQGFWGSILTKGANRSNGDAYSTYWNPNPTLNAGYDPLGYSYIVDFPAGTTGGSVWVFDPIFCAVGRKSANPGMGQRLGIGDFWYNTTNRQVTTEFKLWNMNGSPYTTSDDTMVASDGGLFTNMDYVDAGPNYQGDDNYGAGYNGSGSTDCQANIYHNRWWLLATGLSEGQYRLQVVTSAGASNQNANNEFGLQVTSITGPGGRVYGQSRMCAYVNVVGTSLFYLAQIEAVHAGKTLEIRLFDPGDFANTTLRIKLPGSAGYSNATFSYTADNGRFGNNVTSVVTNDGTNLYQNSWMTINVTLATNYAAPTPPGEPGPGWFKIEFQTAGSGVDVATWEVNIRGNPVHLVTP